MKIIDEQRKRREFLYHIYRNAQYSNSQGGLLPVNCAYTFSVYQDMQRNWGVLGNAGGAPLLHYHLVEGNISITTPHPDGVDKEALSDDRWKYGHLDSIFPKWIFLTSKGMKAIEGDHELLACLIFDGAAIDWTKIETAFTKQPENNPPKLTSPQIVALGEKISDVYKIDELHTLVKKLSTDYENLPGETRDRKAQELVDYANRHGRVPKLLEILREERPRETWSIETGD
ncbi:hypothetical protein [Candidatus Leptofilum sp.]|uniref:hypothetical protein n=1 Tax=Candidatus Leptofilum sp. TaxID=3241576 RepID=UPI003B5B3CF8